MDLGRLKKYFILSIFLNVLFLGILIGYGFGELWGGCKPNRKFPKYVETSVSPQQQKAIKQALTELRRESRDDFRALKRTRRQLRNILAAPQFDPEAYEANMKALEEIRNRLQTRKTQTIKELAQNLNVQERQMLTYFLEKGMHGKKKRGPRHRSPPLPHRGHQP